MLAQAKPRRRETPMAFVQAIVAAYARYGRDPSDALARARITPSQLRRAHARVDADQLEILSARAMQELDDEALGWFSRRLPWGTYGMLCRASLGSPTLGVALKRWCRHHRLLTEDVLLTLRPESGGARLALEERVELGTHPVMREFCLLTSLRYVHGYACWLVNARVPLIEVTFPFGAPRHHAVYPLLFPGPVRFGASRASLLVEERYLSIAPKRDERALETMLRRALPLTVRQYRRDRFLVERVREQLATPAPEAHRGGSLTAATAESLAAALHVSVRSLHRQLGREGASLQRLKDGVRQQKAAELLRRTSLPIKQVARAAGFASEKSFARAFRAWTGQSPSEHRRAGDAR